MFPLLSTEPCPPIVSSADGTQNLVGASKVLRGATSIAENAKLKIKVVEKQKFGGVVEKQKVGGVCRCDCTNRVGKGLFPLISTEP